MRFTSAAAFFLGLYQLSCVNAHGHEHGDGPQEGETIKEYAIRHMVKEHHIDEFDLQSFFALHDLNGDRILDKSEIEAIYGVHHLDSQKKSPDEAAHAAKAKKIVDEVLAKMDKNKDGALQLEEFMAAGFAGLPDFTSLGAEGHHYDEESEFFLHHEELYHNTPETQTDESYTHPEDIEHFGSHEKIELVEENKERVFQGLKELSMEEMQKIHDAEDAEIEKKRKELSESALHAATATSVPGTDEEVPGVTSLSSPPTGKAENVKWVRPPRTKKDPKEQLKGAVQEAIEKSEWGTGQDGFKSPKSPADKMRKNVPYKYKFRRNWGDF